MLGWVWDFYHQNVLGYCAIWFSHSRARALVDGWAVEGGRELTAGPARVGADSAFPNTGECAFFSGYDPYSRSSEPRGYMGPDPALH